MLREFVNAEVSQHKLALAKKTEKISRYELG